MTPEQAARNLYAQLIGAWNSREAETYAGLFVPDATMIGFDGSQVAGADVGEHLAPIFAHHPTAAYVTKIREVRELGEGNVALLRAIVGMLPPGESELNSKVNALHTLVAEKTEGQWKIVLFQNTAAQYIGRPELTEQHTAELQALC